MYSVVVVFTNRVSLCLSSCTERHLICCHYAYVITRREFGFGTVYSVLLQLTICPAFYSSIVQSLCRLSLISAFTQLCSVLGDAIGVAVACTVIIVGQRLLACRI